MRRSTVVPWLHAQQECSKRGMPLQRTAMGQTEPGHRQVGFGLLAETCACCTRWSALRLKCLSCPGPGEHTSAIWSTTRQEDMEATDMPLSGVWCCNPLQTPGLRRRLSWQRMRARCKMKWVVYALSRQERCTRVQQDVVQPKVQLQGLSISR